MLRTAVLLLRNSLLIYATVCLWVAVRKMGPGRRCVMVPPAGRRGVASPPGAAALYEIPLAGSTQRAA